jgi:hypothetical protein
VPPAYRITQPGRGRLASATFDYILGRNVAFESPPQIGATRLTERLPLTCDLAFHPSPVPPVVEATFWRRAQALFAQVRWQTRQAGWLASVLGALVAGMAVASVVFRWRERHRRHGAQIITTDAAGGAGDGAGVSTFSASSPEPGEAELAVWQTRALQAEEMAQQAAAVARARLTPHLGKILKEKAVAWLHSQRTQLLNSHESGTAQVMELEQRLSQIQWRFEEALTARDRRIADLEQELAAREKLLHDVLQTQVGLTQRDRD